MRRVVITGVGAVSPFGVGAQLAFNQIKNSKSGLSKITSFNVDPEFDVNKLPSLVAGIIPKGPASENKFNVEEWMNPKEARRVDHFIQYAICAARLAMKDSGLEVLSEQEKLMAGTYIGSGIGGLQQIYENSVLLGSDNYRKISPFFIPSALVNLASGHVAIEYGLQAQCSAVVTACAAGTHSIGESFRLIRSGDADIMVAGGAEAPVIPIGVAGFARMNALSTKFNDNPTQASRPWDKDRDGFVIAEGAGILILEELERAKARGAKIYGEVIGYGASGDAYHITAPSEDGSGARRSMEAALRSAKITIDDIDYINAHGTSTPAGDMVEIKAVKGLLNGKKPNFAMSSTKSATGHLLGAAGALEAVLCLLAMKENILMPTLNLHNVEEEAEGIDLVPHTAKQKELNIVMSNSFGFGGTNATIIFKKYKG
jgi:3-oxoacyl-[acyl-carrier-protein] synthase II